MSEELYEVRVTERQANTVAGMLTDMLQHLHVNRVPVDAGVLDDIQAVLLKMRAAIRGKGRLKIIDD